LAHPVPAKGIANMARTSMFYNIEAGLLTKKKQYNDIFACFTSNWRCNTSPFLLLNGSPNSLFKLSALFLIHSFTVFMGTKIAFLQEFPC
jgi:hypothetical protein